MQALRTALFLATASALCGQPLAYNVLPAATAAAPNVVYTATGTLASTLISGTDPLSLAGQNFTISIPASEALKPTRHNQTSAEYTNLQMTGTGYTGLSQGYSIPISCPTTTIELRVGAAGAPDEFLITYQVSADGAVLPVTVSAKVTMPPGTITTQRIQPFTAPVTFTPTDVKVSYDSSGITTELGIASGTLSTAVQSGSSLP